VEGEEEKGRKGQGPTPGDEGRSLGEAQGEEPHPRSPKEHHGVAELLPVEGRLEDHGHELVHGP